MMLSGGNQKQVRRIVSFLTICFFLVSQVSFANPGAGIEVAANREMPGFLRIDIPTELASLDGIWEAPSSVDSRVVLHIQNAHANYGAQKKIEELLEYLNKTYAINTIFVEGAAEDLNPDYLKLFPDKARNLELADLLAQQGELTGAELYLLEADYGPQTTDPRQKRDSKLQSPVSSLQSGPVRGVGIEDAGLYRSNYEALKKVFGAEALVNRYLQGYESRLEALSSKIFTNDLRRILADWQKFEKGHREFMPYIRSLAADAKRVLDLDLESLFSQVEWPQITRLLVLQGMEKELDTAKALEEKDKLISFLKAKGVSPRIIAEVENFKEQRLSVRQGEGEMMEPRDVLEALVKEAGPNGFRFSEYPAFSLYAGYLILKSELDAKGLFEEIKALFGKILGKLAESPQQKSLLELYRDEELARKLLSLELSRRDWKDALGRKTEIQMDSMVSRLKDLSSAVTKEMNLAPSDLETRKLSPKFQEQILDLYGSAFSFYEFARQRESMFYEKINAVMGKGSSSKAVLITGGFHTDGMTDLFREHNISYGVLTPRLMEKSDEKLYRNTMLQNEKQLFTISYLELANGATSLATRKDQGFDPSKELGDLIKAFRSKLPKEYATGQGVADAFNGSIAAKAFGITLEFQPEKTSETTGIDTYKVKGLQKFEGIEVPVSRSEARSLLDIFQRGIEAKVSAYSNGYPLSQSAFDEAAERTRVLMQADSISGTVDAVAANFFTSIDGLTDPEDTALLNVLLKTVLFDEQGRFREDRDRQARIASIVSEARPGGAWAMLSNEAKQKPLSQVVTQMIGLVQPIINTRKGKAGVDTGRLEAEIRFAGNVSRPYEVATLAQGLASELGRLNYLATPEQTEAIQNVVDQLKKIEGEYRRRSEARLGELYGYMMQKVMLPAVLAMWLAVPSFAAAENSQPYSVRLDPTMGMEAGATNLYSAYRGLNEFVINPVTAHIPYVEDNALGRLAKWGTLDNITVGFVVAQHEIFGHGARSRGEGDYGSTYEIEFAPPRQWEDLKWSTLVGWWSGAAARGDMTYTVDGSLATTAGGMESTQVMSDEIRRSVYRNGGTYQDGLLYYLAKLDLSNYIFNTSNPGSHPGQQLLNGGGASNDVQKYYENMVKKYGEDAGLWEDMQRVALWNALDPTLWMALWEQLDYVGRGNKDFTLPRILPYTGANLTPLGPEYYLGANFTAAELYWDIYGRRGVGPSGDFYGVGLRVGDIDLGNGYFLGVNLDGWKQEGEVGYSAEATIGRNITDNLKVVLGAGYKTDGDLKGQPSDEGPSVSIKFEVPFSKPRSEVRGKEIEELTSSLARLSPEVLGSLAEMSKPSYSFLSATRQKENTAKHTALLDILKKNGVIVPEALGAQWPEQGRGMDGAYVTAPFLEIVRKIVTDTIDGQRLAERTAFVRGQNRRVAQVRGLAEGAVLALENEELRGGSLPGQMYGTAYTPAVPFPATSHFDKFEESVAGLPAEVLAELERLSKITPASVEATTKNHEGILALLGQQGVIVPLALGVEWPKDDTSVSGDGVDRNVAAPLLERIWIVLGDKTKVANAVLEKQRFEKIAEDIRARNRRAAQVRGLEEGVALRLGAEGADYPQFTSSMAGLSPEVLGSLAEMSKQSYSFLNATRQKENTAKHAALLGVLEKNGVIVPEALGAQWPERGRDMDGAYVTAPFLNFVQKVVSQNAAEPAASRSEARVTAVREAINQADFSVVGEAKLGTNFEAVGKLESRGAIGFVIVAAVAGMEFDNRTDKLKPEQMADVIVQLASASVAKAAGWVQAIRDIFDGLAAKLFPKTEKVSIMDKPGVVFAQLGREALKDIGAGDLAPLGNKFQEMVYIVPVQNEAGKKEVQPLIDEAKVRLAAILKDLDANKRFDIVPMVIDKNRSRTARAALAKLASQRMKTIAAVAPGQRNYVLMGAGEGFLDVFNEGGLLPAVMINEGYSKDANRRVATSTLASIVSQRLLSASEVDAIREVLSGKKDEKGFYSFSAEALNKMLTIAMQVAQSIQSAA
ncbi:MAG: hypothetical protein V1882_03465 [Candidatus Omnitrophota bacterium]